MKSKLDKILDELCWKPEVKLENTEEAKQAIKDLMLEIIGEDEDIRDPADLRKNITMPIFRNSLRAEQRKRISEL